MENMPKTKELKEKISDLERLIEDFLNLHQSKKNKILNLQREIEDIKQNMNKYLDDLEDLIDQK